MFVKRFTMQSRDQILPFARIVAISVLAALVVFCGALLAQWIIYDDWLRRTGPLRIVGTSIATVLTFGFVLLWQYSAHRRREELERRFEAICVAHDRIRNALQSIVCVSFVNDPQFTRDVRRALEVIDTELRDIVEDVGAASKARKQAVASGSPQRMNHTSA